MDGGQIGDSEYDLDTNIQNLYFSKEQKADHEISRSVSPPLTPSVGGTGSLRLLWSDPTS